MALAHVEGVLGEGRQQRFVGEDVDAPREPFRCLGHAPVGAAAKDVGAAVTDGAHAEIHILAHLLGRECLQIKAMGDALVELTDFRLTEIVIEFRLTEQNDLQQLVAIGLQVAEQPDLLQGRDGHALRFFDEDHDLAVVGVLLQKPFLERVHDLQAVAAGLHGQLHFHSNGLQGVLRRQAWIRQIDDIHPIRQALLQHPAKHGLAAAHLADHFDDAFAAVDRVHQSIEDLAAVAAGIEQLGVRRYPEGRALEAEVFVIHRFQCRP